MLRIYVADNGQRKRHTETNTNQAEVTFLDILDARLILHEPITSWPHHFSMDFLCCDGSSIDICESYTSLLLLLRRFRSIVQLYFSCCKNAYNRFWTTDKYERKERERQKERYKYRKRQPNY